MDGFYQSVETSLLAVALALALAASVMATKPGSPFASQAEIVLPMVDVVGDAQ